MNNLKVPYFLDPTGKPSMSASLVWVFGVTALILNILKAFGKVNDVGNINELFFSTIALYFSNRNITFGGKQYTATKAKEIESKIEQ